jgi:hypothetical protein
MLSSKAKSIEPHDSPIFSAARIKQKKFVIFSDDVDIFTPTKDFDRVEKKKIKIDYSVRSLFIFLLIHSLSPHPTHTHTPRRVVISSPYPPKSETAAMQQHTIGDVSRVGCIHTQSRLYSCVVVVDLLTFGSHPVCRQTPVYTCGGERVKEKMIDLGANNRE